MYLTSKTKVCKCDDVKYNIVKTETDTIITKNVKA